MENNIERIGMAQMCVRKAPGIITTIGLGSCVGVTLYDKVNKVGGMLHLMLSDSTRFAYSSSSNMNRAKYADTGIKDLLSEMINTGARKENIVAKMAGGAQMFAISDVNDVLNIGDRNIEATRKILEELDIPLLSEDVGDTYGRTVELDLDNGELKVMTVNRDVKFI